MAARAHRRAMRVAFQALALGLIPAGGLDRLSWVGPAPLAQSIGWAFVAAISVRVGRGIATTPWPERRDFM
jgi:hypothetical protein